MFRACLPSCCVIHFSHAVRLSFNGCSFHVSPLSYSAHWVMIFLQLFTICFICRVGFVAFSVRCPASSTPAAGRVGGGLPQDIRYRISVHDEVSVSVQNLLGYLSSFFVCRVCPLSMVYW